MISYTTNQYGLRQKDMDYMMQLFARTPSLEKVILYGSRATGDYERGSDVDLAIVGENVTYSDITCWKKKALHCWVSMYCTIIS